MEEEEQHNDGGEFSDSPAISDSRLLSDCEFEPDMATSELYESHTPCFSGPVTYVEDCNVSMNDLRRNQDFCDITLIVKNETFHAHKVILASRSPFFLGMFKSNMAESTKTEVTLTGQYSCCITRTIC
eukprot:sb/3475409/